MDVVAKMEASWDKNLPQGDRGSFREAVHGRGLVRRLKEKVDTTLF